jgi:hypothetical protein
MRDDTILRDISTTIISYASAFVKPLSRALYMQELNFDAQIIDCTRKPEGPALDSRLQEVMRGATSFDTQVLALG